MDLHLSLRFVVLVQKKIQHQGFTLIELLVVVILVGVLAAITLPNYLAQVGKGRETEMKNAVGTINRAQQSYHWEFGVFAGSEAQLKTNVLPGKTLDQIIISPTTGNATKTTIVTVNNEAITEATRAYSGGTTFDGVGNYSTIVCQTDVPIVNGLAPSGAPIMSCPAGATALR